MPHCDPACSRQRKGLTLFEVILVLVLSSTLLMMIGGAIGIQMRSMEASQQDLEQAQLARAILRHITNDLRNVVLVDAEILAYFNASGTTDDGSAEGSDELADPPADGPPRGDEPLPSSDLSSSSDEGTEDPTQAIDPSLQTIPGLYGTQFEIRMDVLKTSRPNLAANYAPAASSMISSGPTNQPSLNATNTSHTWQNTSGLQTITYSLSQATSNTQLPTNGLNQPTPGATTNGTVGIPLQSSGLTRQVMGHSASAWSRQNGATLANQGEVLASEVYDLSFRYFDGTQWLVEWDSYQQGGLPVAVEVTLAIAPPIDPENTITDSSIVNSTAPNYAGVSTEGYYRTVVKLPVAEPTDQTEALY